jgi:flagellar operon protein
MMHQINNVGLTGALAPAQQKIMNSHADVTFAQLLKDKVQQGQGVKFSGHAMERLKDRNINLSREQLSKLDDTVNQASAKGAKSSLIMMDNLALIVSIKNKTVITAIDGKSMKDNIFTNIDSAAII